jgi:multiple sugar transport system permease protein
LVRVGYGILYLLLALGALVVIVPMYWLFVDGVKNSNEIQALPPSWIPQHPDWNGWTSNNFTNSWDLLELGKHLVNSLILVSGSWLFQVLVSVPAAYSLSKLRPAYSSVILGFFFATLLVPPITYIVPQYININGLPIFNWDIATGNWVFLGVLLPEAANAFNLYILKSFFDDIPDEIMDAARIDGSSAFDSLIRIVLPMSKAVLAVITILTVMAAWKDFVWPYVVTAGDTDHQPLMVSLYYAWFSRGLGTPDNVMFAAFGLVSIPPIVMFLFFQRQIIRGISLTGLTG